MPGSARGPARYRRIIRFAARQLVVAWWYEIVLPSIGLTRLAERSRAQRLQRFARKFRMLAVDLGGLMIKLGQFMSSRLDVLPAEFTRELEGLQDEVPPVPFDAIRALAEAELGVPLTHVYADVDQTPVAAASLGQAYRAQLGAHDAAEAGFDSVIIKVQRPGIEDIVAVDLAALRKVGGWLSRVRLVSTRANMPALVEEFALTCLQEIDYINEGVNAEHFAADFADDPRVRVPDVVWERTTRRVLTLEDVTAIKITDRAALTAAGIDPSDVARAFAEVMFDQFFVHGFFHADPHPGNLFVTPATGGGAGAAGDAGAPPWTLTFVDFGMMGDVPPMLRTTLRALIIAAAARDGKGMVTAMRDAGVLLPSADTHELENVMTQVFARFGGMGFAELRELDPSEFRAFALEFSDVLFELPFQLPENLLLLYRAGALTSGLCSSLDPTYNLWDSIEPYAEQLLRDEGGNLIKDVATQAMEVASVAWRLPGRVDGLITRAEDGDLAVTTPRLEKAVARLERTGRRAVSAILFGGLLIAGAIVRPDDAGLGTVLMLASAVPGLFAVFAGRGRP
jgi:predicted unusual protein kinase regulating ubiquinone biosynthesis (AarF/ABC1/UbiB family)